MESRAYGRRSIDLQSCLLVAESQTAGRGRLGRAWHSAAGASLTFSLAVPMSPVDWSGMSLVVGVVIADALDPPDRAAARRIGVKWPNDLWLMDGDVASGTGRKLGGILVETIGAGEQRMAVVGVGINVLPVHAPGATTGVACMQELDPQATAPQVLERIAKPLVQALQQFEQEGFAIYAGRYVARDVLAARHVTTTLAEVPEGVALGVSDNGSLRIRLADGSEQLVGSGEVSVRPQSAA